MGNEKEFKHIDLSTWTCFSDRANSKSYVSADKKWMVKFDSETSLNDEMVMHREQEMARKALKFLETIEQQNFCVHGDFQTGNVILAGDKSYWIDLSFMGYGNPEFDVGMLYTFCHIFPKAYTDTVFHCDRKHLPTIWNSFIRHYYETENEQVINEKTERARKVSSICLYTNMQFIKFDESKAPVMRKLIDDAL